MLLINVEIPKQLKHIVDELNNLERLVLGTTRLFYPPDASSYSEVLLTTLKSKVKFICIDTLFVSVDLFQSVLNYCPNITTLAFEKLYVGIHFKFIKLLPNLTHLYLFSVDMNDLMSIYQLLLDNYLPSLRFLLIDKCEIDESDLVS